MVRAKAKGKARQAREDDSLADPPHGNSRKEEAKEVRKETRVAPKEATKAAPTNFRATAIIAAPGDTESPSAENSTVRWQQKARVEEAP